MKEVLWLLIWNNLCEVKIEVKKQKLFDRLYIPLASRKCDIWHVTFLCGMSGINFFGFADIVTLSINARNTYLHEWQVSRNYKICSLMGYLMVWSLIFHGVSLKKHLYILTTHRKLVLLMSLRLLWAINWIQDSIHAKDRYCSEIHWVQF